MGITTRTETYWTKNRLLGYENIRPSGYGPWPTIIGELECNRVATISGSFGTLAIKQGPKATAERVADSLLIHRGINPKKIDNSLWQELPDSLIKKISESVATSDSDISQKLAQFSNEEAVTGSFFNGIDRKLVTGQWTALLKFVEFSKQSKEPITGADVALVIDILGSKGRRCFKSIWFQAKIADKLPPDWKTLPRLEGQFLDMRQHTAASYGLIYTSSGTFVVGEKRPKARRIDAVISDAMRCKVGDKTISTLGQSLSRMSVFQILIAKTKR